MATVAARITRIRDERSKRQRLVLASSGTWSKGIFEAQHHALHSMMQMATIDEADLDVGLEVDACKDAKPAEATDAPVHRHVYCYRDDIDGLRAVAVLAVILFHTDGRWLPGGFVGVAAPPPPTGRG